MVKQVSSDEEHSSTTVVNQTQSELPQPFLSCEHDGDIISSVNIRVNIPSCEHEVDCDVYKCDFECGFKGDHQK
jgi:hypothetical protein